MVKMKVEVMVKLLVRLKDNKYCCFIIECISKGNAHKLLPKDKKKCLSTKVSSFIIREFISKA